MLLFTSVAALATTLCFGSVPALTASRAPLATLLNTSSTRVVGSRGRLGSMLVIGQVGLSVLVLVGAGLFVRTLYNLRTVDPGFRHDGLLIVRADGARAGYAGAALLRMYDELLQTTAQIPGVKSASYSIVAPPSGGSGISLAVQVNGQPTGEDEFHVNRVSPHYFETMTTTVLFGREFTARDDAAAPRVAVVNKSFADRYITVAGVPVVGQHVSMGGPSATQAQMEVIGVVHDAVYETLRAGAPPTVYLPIAQGASADSVIFEIATDGRESQVASAIRDEYQRRLPRTFVEVRTLISQIERTLVQDRLMATLATSFGVVGLMLAATGLYGLLAYLVVTRTNEIGVRMALGATRVRVVWTVLRNALALLIVGAACGVAAAWSASHLVASMLFGVGPFDLWTILGATILLMIVGALAGAVPAFRAATVDPLIALHWQ